MNFHTRKWVKPEDLNPNGTLFGGSLLRWIDEEAAIYAIVQLGNQRVVTKYISEINFVSASRQGDIIELGITATEFGRTSITLTCEVRNKITRKKHPDGGEDGLRQPRRRRPARAPWPDRDQVRQGSVQGRLQRRMTLPHRTECQGKRS